MKQHSSMIKRVCLVIPSCNEENRIGKTLGEYCTYFYKIQGDARIDFEIIVVINNSDPADKTLEIVAKYASEFGRITSINAKPKDKGFAVIAGFNEALKKDFGLIGFVDADLATPPLAFHDLINKIGYCDGIIASRWMKGSIISSPQSFTRKVCSRGFNFIVRSILLLKYTDTQCGAKLFKRATLEDTIQDLNISKWAFDVGLLFELKKAGFKIRETPTLWAEHGGSTLDLKKVPLQMLSSVIRLRLIYSHLKFVVELYDKLPETIKLHHNLLS